MINRISRPVRRLAVDVLENRVLFATAVGLTADDELVTFDTATPGTASAPVAVTGLTGPETLVGIDFRPATGQLFGLGSTGQIYTINRASGAATAVGSTPLTLSGTNFGLDFNPAVDRIRAVSDADINLRANPETGAPITPADTNLAYDAADTNNGQNPNVVAVAYDNNVASASSTTLYGIDTATDVLVTQGSEGGSPVSPNAGTLFTVGDLGIDVDPAGGGMDVAESDNTAYAALRPQGGSASTLYTINLDTGAATSVGAIGSNLVLKDLSVAPVQRTLYVLASSGTAIATIDTGDLATNPTAVNVTGLAGGQTLASIDFRPATGQLFGATTSGALYTIDPATGAATAVGSGLGAPLTGDVEEIDFNPTVDRIRVLTNDDSNARANPDTGALADADTNTTGVQIDTDLDFATGDANAGDDPNLVAAAYTNSAQGETATTLFALDAGNDALVTIGTAEGVTPAVSPNTGQLLTVGALGVDVTSGGLDIANDGPAFALVNAAGGTGTQLYTVNTGTGAMTLVGTVGDGTQTFADVAVGSAVFTASPATQNVAENAGNATITVTRAGDATGAATVAFSVLPPAQDAAVAPATAGSDFGTAGQSAFTGAVTFADGETSKTITVPIINDTSDEPDESFVVAIAGPSSGGLGSLVQSTVVITDDDEATTPGSVTVAADPIRTTGKATQVLTVNGTAGDDVIVLQQQGSNIVATLNGTAVGTPTPVRGLYRIVVFAGAGNDEVRLNSKLKFSGEIHGQDGDDLLVGSKGRDLLVGGEGTDALFGRGGEDVVIGGASDYTANPTATATLLNTFLGKGNFATRANAVSTGTGVNNFIFSTNTIDDDTDRDYLAGEGTADLILTHAQDSVADEANKGIVRAL